MAREFGWTPSRREFAAIPVMIAGAAATAFAQRAPLWVSEDQGMRIGAGWLKSCVPEVPVEWIAAGDPLWRP